MILHTALGIDLAIIDQALRSVVESDPTLPHPSPIRDHVLRILAAGGKRLRPMMVVVGSRFGKPGQTETVMRTAALLEYMHTASLIHDDIIDNSDLRRGERTLHAATDVHTAIHVANYMMARAVEWASSAEGMNARGDDNNDDIFLIAGLASLTMELCLGEYGQLHDRFNFNLTLDNYLAKTRRKTALLIANSLQAGGNAALADEETYQLLFDFGVALGMAFQIKDDVLDFTKSKEVIGKPVGADLRNGNVTLPVLYALEDPDLAFHIRSLHAGSPETEMAEAIHRINESGAPDRALKFARQYALQAEKQIDLLSAHPAKRDLQTLLDYFTQD